MSLKYSVKLFIFCLVYLILNVSKYNTTLTYIKLNLKILYKVNTNLFFLIQVLFLTRFKSYTGNFT